MNDPENPLARWSRRKSDARAGGEDAALPSGQSASEKDASASSRDAMAPSEVPAAFDPTSLPALESINAGTDLRAFLDQGVPLELTTAALRRGWSTDPAICDFIGLSENSWDFNAPGGASGFGPLTSEDSAQLLAQMLEGVARDEMLPSAASSASDQTAPGAEHAKNAQVPQDEAAHVSAHDLGPPSDQDGRPRHAAFAPGVPVDGPDAIGAQPDRDQNTHRPSRQHRHGGALPHFEAAPLEK